MNRCLLAAFLVAGCSASHHDSDPGDKEGARFDAADDTAPGDGLLARAMLAMLNDPALTFAELDDDAGVHRNAVEAIFAHRDGADGEPGGGDDDPFDSLAELDRVDFVGPKALGRLLDHTARTRKPGTVAGIVIQTIVTGLETEEGDFCVFIALTESGERIGFTDATGDCFAAVFSEHPEDELAMVAIDGDDLEFLTDPAEVDELRELEPSAFYVRLNGPVKSSDREVRCTSTDDPQLIESLHLVLGGESFRLGRGFLQLGFDHPINESGDVLEDGRIDPLEGELSVVIDSVEHGDNSSSFELGNKQLKMAFELTASGSKVVASHGGDEFESALDCEL